MDEYRTLREELGQRPRPAMPMTTLNWRAAIAGAFVALAGQVALMMLGAALGNSLFTYTSSNTVARGAGLFTSIWSLLSLTAAAFAGGVIAGMCARGRSRYHGVLEGTLAWSIGLLGAVAFVWRDVAALFPVGALPTAQHYLWTEAAGGPAYGLVGQVVRVPALWTLFGAIVLSLLASVLGAVIAGSAREDMVAGFGRISQTPPELMPGAKHATTTARTSTRTTTKTAVHGSSKIHIHGPLPSEG